jgi:hypothetical protein
MYLEKETVSVLPSQFSSSSLLKVFLKEKTQGTGTVAKNGTEPLFTLGI